MIVLPQIETERQLSSAPQGCPAEISCSSGAHDGNARHVAIPFAQVIVLPQTETERHASLLAHVCPSESCRSPGSHDGSARHVPIPGGGAGLFVESLEPVEPPESAS
jgi:hypothetical protein